MKPRIFVSFFFILSSFFLAAQDKNLLCKSTLPLNAETVSKIFTALENRSLFILDSSSIYYTEPGICLEGELESGCQWFPGYKFALYVFNYTTSKNEAIQKFDELLKEFKKCGPANWYATDKEFNKSVSLRPAGEETELKENSSNNTRYYRFTDKKNYYNKSVGLLLGKEGNDQWAIQLLFELLAPEEEKYMKILDGLKDGSLRGAELPNSTGEWKTNITLEGQIRSHVWSYDYGKSKGKATAVYYFAEGGDGKRDESIKLYNELKENLKMFKPEQWRDDEYEFGNKSWVYELRKYSEGKHIQLFFTDDNKVYMNFTLFWPPPEE